MANRKARRAAKTLASRDAILALKSGRYEDVPIHGLDEPLRVAAVSAGARDAFELAMRDVPEADREKNFRARLLVMSCIDEDGKQLFAIDHIAGLSALDAVDIEPAIEVALRLNGFSQKDRDELEKNS